MALKFGDAKGTAATTKLDRYAYADGMNKVRLFGGILARYVYWIKGSNNKDVPFECLAFNREEERFDNVEKDWVQTMFPKVKCQWAYAMQYVKPDGTVAVIDLKKKLLQQIFTAAEDLGDPTDPDTGWDVVFEKKKTGPLPINVEYTLHVLKCKPRPLTDEEREGVSKAKDISELIPRVTPEAQKAALEKLKSGGGETEESIDETIEEEFDIN